jgi:hypothetical protein
MPRRWIKTVAIASLVVGVIAMTLAVVYLFVRASSLPSWMPGNRAPIRLRSGHLVTFGLLKRHVAVFAVVAAAALILAWWVAFRYEPND